MSLRLAAWSSGIRSSAESTSETLASFEKASCFCRSSSSERALASAENPERPAVARMRRSQTTDSVFLDWRLRRL